jgi:prolyl-tRNA synthetase
VVGDKGLAEGLIEVKVRRTGVKTRVAPAELIQHLRAAVPDLDGSSPR